MPATSRDHQDDTKPDDAPAEVGVESGGGTSLVDAGRAAASAAGTLAGGGGKLIAAWLPIGVGVGLLVHLSHLGLRPALEEREFLDQRRERLAAEGAELDAQELELLRLERALDDPIYRERLRWRWRLEGATASASGTRSGAAGEGTLGEGAVEAVGPVLGGTGRALPPLSERPRTERRPSESAPSDLGPQGEEAVTHPGEAAANE